MKVGERDDRGTDPRARGGEGGVPAGEERGQEGERSSSRSGRTCSRPASPTWARARTLVVEIEFQQTLVRSTRARYGCASRSWWGRATSRAPGDGEKPVGPRLGARHGPRSPTRRGSRRRWCGRARAPQPGGLIEVELDAGFPLQSLVSRYHAIVSEPMVDGRYHVKLARGGRAGRSRLRARLDAGARSDAAGRPVPRRARRRDLRAPDALASCRPGGRGRGCRARSCT